jgi:hypothetical protein
MKMTPYELAEWIGKNESLFLEEAKNDRDFLQNLADDKFGEGTKWSDFDFCKLDNILAASISFIEGVIKKAGIKDTWVGAQRLDAQKDEWLRFKSHGFSTDEGEPICGAAFRLLRSLYPKAYAAIGEQLEKL